MVVSGREGLMRWRRVKDPLCYRFNFELAVESDVHRTMLARGGRKRERRTLRGYSTRCGLHLHRYLGQLSLL